jgi:hypothetical protein
MRHVQARLWTFLVWLALRTRTPLWMFVTSLPPDDRVAYQRRTRIDATGTHTATVLQLRSGVSPPPRPTDTIPS